jgi:hypothetical protein
MPVSLAVVPFDAASMFNQAATTQAPVCVVPLALEAFWAVQQHGRGVLSRVQEAASPEHGVADHRSAVYCPCRG